MDWSGLGAIDSGSRMTRRGGRPQPIDRLLGLGAARWIWKARKELTFKDGEVDDGVDYAVAVEVGPSAGPDGR